MKFQGLSSHEVEKLQKQFGPNSLSEEKSYNALNIFLSQFKSPLIYILLVVIAISFFFKEYLDAILVIAVITVNVGMGFFQEYSAQKTLASLKKIIRPTAILIRDGLKKTINADEIVPGDIVHFGAGDTIPADGHIVDGTNILVNEAILTGEEEPVQKSILKNSVIVFMGTTVVSGRGILVVDQIGIKTEIGKIGKSLTEIKDTSTPLQEKLEAFSRTLVAVIILVTGMIFLIGLAYNQEFWHMFRIAIVLSVAAIPEGLPIAVTVILSIGVRRILKKNGLVKKLLSIETLGATSVICTDKTGTLTEGVMQVVKTNFKNHKDALMALVLVNTQRTSLEIAIWSYLKKHLGLDPQTIIDRAEILYEEAFESDKRFAKTTARVGSKTATYVIGAPEVIINFCTLTKKQKMSILLDFENWAKSGLRVVCLGEKSNDNKSNSGFQYLGLIGVKDPVRKTVAESIARARRAGIDVKIVTGDYLHTALRVAEEVGLEAPEGSFMEGKELDKISPEELRSRIKATTLFARIAPIQKLKIIEALQANGEVVAMTGDGVNDAPALKRADIGIAVGTATDVAKAASDLILLDSDFKTIISAVEEGRIIFANIRKVVAYVLSNSFAEIILIVGAIILNVPLPITIVQILWVQLICDGPPGIVLGFEPKETGIMDEKPNRLIQERILDLPMLLLVFVISFTAGIVALMSFLHVYNGHNLVTAQTVAFSIIGLIGLTYVFSYKGLRRSIFKINLFDNKYLLWAVIYGLTLLYLGIYNPGVNRLLGTEPMSLGQWLYPIAASIITILWVEIAKAVSTRQARK